MTLALYSARNAKRMCGVMIRVIQPRPHQTRHRSAGWTRVRGTEANGPSCLTESMALESSLSLCESDATAISRAAAARRHSPAARRPQQQQPGEPPGSRPQPWRPPRSCQSSLRTPPQGAARRLRPQLLILQDVPYGGRSADRASELPSEWKRGWPCVLAMVCWRWCS